MDGEPGGEVFGQTVVGEEDEEDQDDEIDNHPAAPDDNKQSLPPGKIITYIMHNISIFILLLLKILYLILLFFSLGNVIKTR